MANRAMIDGLAGHIAGLRRYALALSGGSRHEAEDLVQDTLARAIAAAHTFRPGADPRAWLFSIMHNAFVSGVRGRRMAEQELDDDWPDAAPPPQLLRLEARDVLAALALLPEPQRAALSLIALEEFSYEEAARVLGVPLGTLMSRLARGREALRRIVDGGGAPRPALRVVGGRR
ncbi:MAG TPA: sigma-70 family RNA polymerase sigma factor [Geminicoccaceae bacterium]|nr:sigma-70 family RNA polymerase sigma factor [Geminicoccaceae bacterium]